MSSADTPAITLIHGAVQQYEWGKLGTSSIVAQLAHAAEFITIEDNKPYAELWLGTHSTAHSICPQHDNITLKQHLNNNELDYLFKILSIKKTLSIQAHPDKQLAQQLHTANPGNYRDNQHKPEMAIAITQFNSMCGFRSIQQITSYLRLVPELSDIIGHDNVQLFIANSNNSSEDSNRVQLKHLFNVYMNVSQSILDQHIPKLIQRIKSLSNNIDNTGNDAKTNNESPMINLDAHSVVLQLYSDFHHDIGILCPYFLNCIQLQPGQALFLGPNLPHAYISGDIVECMAQSDNVVRAGLTPKYRDINTLINMLTYEMGHVQQLIPQCIDTYTVRYAPDPDKYPEFALTHTTINESNIQSPYELHAAGKHSILLVYEGSGYIVSHTDTNKTKYKLSKGLSYLIHDGIDIDVVNECNNKLVVYRCSTNTK